MKKIRFIAVISAFALLFSAGCTRQPPPAEDVSSSPTVLEDTSAAAAEQVTSKVYGTMPPIETTLADTDEYLHTDPFFENGYLIAVLHTAAICNQSIEFSTEKENNAVNVSLAVKQPAAATPSPEGTSLSFRKMKNTPGKRYISI